MPLVGPTLADATIALLTDACVRQMASVILMNAGAIILGLMNGTAVRSIIAILMHVMRQCYSALAVAYPTRLLCVPALRTGFANL